MSKPHSVLQRARDSVPQCLVVALFDLSNGEPLSIHADAREPLSHTTTAATVMGELLRRAVADDRGCAETEIVIASGDRVHIGLRGGTKPELGLLFVYRGDIRVGMAIARARICMTEIEEGL